MHVHVCNYKKPYWKFHLFYRANDKTNIFTNEDDFPDIKKRKNQIEAVRREIVDHRREVRIALRQPSLDYVTVMGVEVSV